MKGRKSCTGQYRTQWYAGLALVVADVSVEIVTPPVRGHVLHEQVYLPNGTYS